jgi:hypothetical protein
VRRASLYRDAVGAVLLLLGEMERMLAEMRNLQSEIGWMQSGLGEEEGGGGSGRQLDANSPPTTARSGGTPLHRTVSQILGFGAPGVDGVHRSVGIVRPPADGEESLASTPRRRGWRARRRVERCAGRSPLACPPALARA